MILNHLPIKPFQTYTFDRRYLVFHQLVSPQCMTLQCFFLPIPHFKTNKIELNSRNTVALFKGMAVDFENLTRDFLISCLLITLHCQQSLNFASFFRTETRRSCQINERFDVQYVKCKR